MPRTCEHTLVYDRQETIEVPAGEAEAKIAIRRADWNRIKRLINEIPSETNIYQIVYSILFSVAGAVAISLIPIHSNPNAAPWVFSLYMWLAIFSLVVAIIFCILSKTMRRSRADHTQNIQTDIEEIENTFKIESEESEAITETNESESEIIEPL